MRKFYFGHPHPVVKVRPKEDLRTLFEQLPAEQVGFCLDVGHQKAFSRASLARWLQELGAFLGQLHLHDNDGQSDKHIALGRGTIDFDSLFQWLSTHRNSPPVVTLKPNEEKKLWPSLEYLAPFWPKASTASLRTRRAPDGAFRCDRCLHESHF